MLRDGYTDVPAGRIAAVATFLEMKARPVHVPGAGGGAVAPANLRRVARPTVAWYRDLYIRVGGPWLWYSRLELSEPALEAIIHHPDVCIWALGGGEGQDVGLLELDFRSEGECELAFLGLTPDAIGQGAGRQLMQVAMAEAWARPIERFWVHTCTLDHPAALGFYIRSGFVPYKRAIEMAVDPRLSGVLPGSLAPGVPVLA